MEDTEQRAAQEEDPLFAGMAPERVEITLTADTVAEGERLIQQNGWADEGWRIILAYGISYLKAQGDRLTLTEGEAEPQNLTDRYMKLDAMYSVMKYRAYCLNQDNRVLELHTSGLRGENRALQDLAARLRAEIATLKEENRRLRDQTLSDESAGPGADPLPEERTTPGPRARWVNRLLLALFRRQRAP